MISPTTGRRPSTSTAHHPVHRPRSSQRFVVLVVRPTTLCRGQRRLCFPHPAAPHRYGVSLRDLVWQTDNGSEFKGDFPMALGDSQHVRIPPAAHTYQSDVETVHRIEEDEFFDLESFSSRGDFLAKVHTYQLYFNLARTNSHKENQTPWQIIQRLTPRSPLELCLLPPVFLDYYLNDSGGIRCA